MNHASNILESPKPNGWVYLDVLVKINHVSWMHFAPKGLFIFGSANHFSPRPVDVCDRLDENVVDVEKLLLI